MSAVDAPPRVGNDVVDLTDPRCRGKARDARFLERILAGDERAAVARSDDPHRLLWCLWAAKEAAYKVRVKESRGDPPAFRHAAFGVHLSAALPACPPACGCTLVREGTVAHEGTVVPVRLTLTHRRVHAVAATLPTPAAIAEGVETGVAALTPDERHLWSDEEARADAFTDAEGTAVDRAESAAVRARAREALAANLGVEEGRVEIVSAPGVGGRRGPPEARVDGVAAPADVSLSHHGSFVAWALAVAGGSAQRPIR